MKNLIVSLDIGTSGCRAAAMRTDGSVAARYERTLLPARPMPGMSEYNAVDLINTARTALHAVLDKVGPQHVAALAITSQRSTIVLWDKQTGEAVGPVLTWEDGRAQEQAVQAPLSQEEIHIKTGLYKTPFFSAPKIAWSLQHIPQAADLSRQGRLLAAPVASYLIWHLTEGNTLATDISLAQRTLLFDVHTLAWSETLCNGFGIPPDILPQIRPSAADYGAYTYHDVSIPITACVGDQQAAAVYFGLEKNKSLINYGTGAFWLYHAGEKPVFLPGMLTSVSATLPTKKPDYLLEGPVNAAGSALAWLKEQGIHFGETQTDTLCESAKHPILFLPAFGGLGAPYWDFKTPTSIGNLSPHTRKPDWVAGAVRGIAFLLADIGAYLRANGCEVEGPVQVSGGLSQSSYLTSFQAGLLQLPLEVAHQAEATLLGAALLAAAQADIPCSVSPSYTKVTPTLPADQAHALHKEWQEFVSSCRGKANGAKPSLLSIH